MAKPLIEEKTWPVLLYRREYDRWKKQEFLLSSSAKKHRHLPRITSVAPRKDSIVFPALRQRFSLTSEKDRGTVIRRDNKLLLVSKRRTRALLLEFQSLENCLEFSDAFLRLNPGPSLMPRSRNRDAATSEQSLRDYQPQNGTGPPSIIGDEGQREIVSWIVKMLHDKCFLSYVHKIENYIAETEDGMQILQGLEQSDLSLA
jgi:hypothetical protein